MQTRSGCVYVCVCREKDSFSIQTGLYHGSVLIILLLLRLLSWDVCWGPCLLPRTCKHLLAEHFQLIPSVSPRMFRFTHSVHAVLMLAALCSSGSSGFYPTGSEKDLLDPNVRDWGDYSDLIHVEPRRSKEEEHGDKNRAGELSSSLAPELDFLAEFAGEMSPTLG